MLKDFRESFAADLRNPDFQREFIAAAYEEEGPNGVLRALREVAIANRSMSRLASEAGVARTSLYRSLSEDGNPTFRTLRTALNSLGLDFAIVAKESESSEGASQAAA